MVDTRREEFNQRGLIVVRNLIGQEELREARREAAVLEELDSEIRIVRRPSGIYASRIHLRSDYFGELCQNKCFAPLFEELIGSSAVYVSFAQTIRKPPGATSLGWHQDAYYSAYDPSGSRGLESPDKDFFDGSITFWLAITESNQK